MYDLVNKRFWLFLISGIIILASIISMAIPFGRLKLGSEFSSGSQLRVGFSNSVSQSEMRQELASLGYGDSIIRREIRLGGVQGDFIIRTRVLNDTEKTALVNALQTKFGPASLSGFTNVSAEVATETLRAAAIAVIVAIIGMLLYILWAFRHMPHPLRFAVSAIVALVHDIIVSLGIFSILAGFFGWEVDMMLVIALLTIIGYSVNNTVIIFDRIRENLKMGISSSLDVVINDSVISTLGRCLNTSLTVVITLLALLLFVGASIQNFVVVTLIGVVAGTYDSVCVAPMLLVVWDKGSWSGFMPSRARA